MFLAVLFGSSFFYVQAYETWTSRDVSGLSEIGFTIALISSIFWFSYGTYTKNIIVRMSGALNFIACCTILLAIFTYQNTSAPPRVSHNDLVTIDDIINAYGEYTDSSVLTIVQNRSWDPLIIPEHIENEYGKIDVV